MSAAGERQKRIRARRRNGEVVVPVVVTNEIVGAMLDRGWLLDVESEDRARIGSAVADMLADFVNLPTKNSVTRYGPSRVNCGSVGQTKRKTDP